MNKQPKVFIGCPSFEGMNYCLEQYLQAIRELKYKNFELVVVDNSKTDSYFHLLKEKGVRVFRLPNISQDKMQNVVDSRNMLRDIFLKENFDYFFSLEQDVIPPSNAIESLLAFERDIVSGVYFGVFWHEGKPGIKPLLYTWLTQQEFDEVLKNPEKYAETIKKINENKISSLSELRRHLTQAEIDNLQFIEVKHSGLGCLLIKKEVLEKVAFKKSSGNLGTDDIQFCDDARKLGYKIYAFTGIICEHIKQNNKVDNFS